MVLQHIYGRDPVVGYCDKKYSKSLETGEGLTSSSVRLNRNVINPKVNYILPQYLYGDLPNCYYLIQKAGCAVYGKSSYVEAGRSEYINHNYIFTDVDRALDVFSGESIFDTNVFLSRVEQAYDYDVENAVFDVSNFNVSVVNMALERLSIDRALFEKIVFALIESVHLGTRVYIIPKNMNRRFTDDILVMISGIFYALPKNILRKIGFITYFSTFPSLSNNLDGSIRLACIEKTTDNVLMFDDVLAGGNFIFLLDSTGSEVFYPDDVDTSGIAVTRLFSDAVYGNAGIGYNQIFEKSDVHAYNTYLMYIDYVCNRYRDTPDGCVDDITNILSMSAGFGDLLKKFEAVVKFFGADTFLDVLYSCVSNLLEKSKYNNIMDFANNVFFILDSDNTDTVLKERLNRLVCFFVDKYLSATKTVIDLEDTVAEQICLWSERLVSYAGQANYYKLSNINVYKKLKAAIQNLSPDCVSIYMLAEPCVIKKLSHDIDHLASLYVKNNDSSKEKIFYFILPVLLNSYSEAFKLAWTKGGLHELIRFVTESEHNSILHDLDSGLLSLSEIERSLRLFFRHQANSVVIEKAAKADSRVKAFAKKYKIL